MGKFLLDGSDTTGVLALDNVHDLLRQFQTAPLDPLAVFDDVDGVLYVGDRGSKGGLYSYDGKKATKIDAPKDMLPVYNITIVR